MGSFQKSGWLARSSSSAIRLLFPAMSKTLHEAGDLGVEFGQVGFEVVHDYPNVDKALFSRGFFGGLIGFKQAIDKRIRIERRDIAHLFTCANEAHGQVKFVRNGKDHAALGGAV